MFKAFDDDFLLHQQPEAPVLSPRLSSRYTVIQDLESKQLLKNLLSSDNFPKEFERFAASIVYSITFGLRIINGTEWQLQTSHKCLKNFTIAGQVGAWIIDMFPSLNRLPAPFTAWKTAEECTISTEIAWVLGILCDAGVETTYMQLPVFVLACLAYPDWVTITQNDLDEIVGPDRLPSIDELAKLPHFHAVVEGNLRWHHIVPAGIPYATTQDHYYRGDLIPKGSVVVPLFSAMRIDKHTFNDPEEFRPGRWLRNSQPINFGYGRKICSGRFIARNSLAIAMASLLWAIDIRPKDGRRIDVKEDMFTTGFVSGPKPFSAVVEPRSKERRGVVECVFEAANKDVVYLLNEVRER